MSPDVFFLRKSDRAPPLPPPPCAPAAPTTPPLPRQNKLAPLFLSPDSPFRLPISSPPETASPLKFHRAAASGHRPPYKSRPRAPSPHHGPGPCIDSLHPCPCCPPTELHTPSPPLVDVGAPPSSHHHHLPPVRIPKISSPFSPTAGEFPLIGAAPSPHSGEPFGRRRPRSTVDHGRTWSTGP
jgi:hypothetical protein